MNKDKTYYYFTNQSNFIQVITKGYLSNPFNWDRKIVDFEEELENILYKSMFFSERLLDLPYTFFKKKTLFPVAMGISIDVLQKLNPLKCNITEEDQINIVNDIIPIDYLSNIVFKNEDDLKTLHIRRSDYIALVDAKKISVDKNIFNDSIKINKDFKLPVGNNISEEQEYTLKKERHVSKKIGSIGNYIINLIDNERFEVLLLIDYLSDLKIVDEIDIDLENFNNIMTDINDAMQPVSCTEAVLTILILKTKYNDIDNTINENDFTRIIKLLTSSNYSDLEEIILSIDNILLKIGNDVKKIDRSDILERIIKDYKSRDNINNKDNKFICRILDDIVKVYKNQIKRDELIVKINDYDDEVIRCFIRGLEIYLKEPADISKIERAIELEKNELPNISQAIAYFLWGRTRGAFSFIPEKKKHLNNVFKPIKFILLSNYNEFLEGFVNSIDQDELIDESSIKFDKHSIEKYNIFSMVDNKKETEKHIEYDLKIKSSTGLVIDHTIKDFFNHEFDIIDNMIHNVSSISDDDLKFLLIKGLRFENKLSFMGKDFLSFEIDDDIKINNKIKESDLQLSLNAVSNKNIKNFPFVKKLSKPFIKIFKDKLIVHLTNLFKDSWSREFFNELPFEYKMMFRNHLSLSFNDEVVDHSKTSKKDLTNDINNNKLGQLDLNNM